MNGVKGGELAGPVAVAERPRKGPGRRLWVAAALAAAVATSSLGIAVAPTYSAVGLTAAGLGFLALALSWAQPVLFVVLMLAFASGLIAPDVVDLRLPVGGLDLRDLTLVVGLFVLAVRNRLLSVAPAVPTAFALPLLILIGLSGYSALYALLYHGIDRTLVLGELRPLLYYSAFFVVIWAVAGRRDLLVVVATLFLTSDAIVALSVGQQFLGHTNLLLPVMGTGNWLVWEQSAGGTAFGSVRVIPPGHVLLYVTSVLAFALTVYPRFSVARRTFFGVQFVYLCLGLLLTYTRSQWLASALAIGALCIFLPFADKRRVAGLAAASLMFVLVLTLGGSAFVSNLQSSQTFALIGERAASIFSPEETLETDSLLWRAFETDEAMRSISEEPLLGVGLGNAYRNVTTLGYEAQRVSTRFTRFVHNSFLSLTVKMGLPGLLAFLWCCGAFVFLAFRDYLLMDDTLSKRMVLALVVSFVGVLPWSIFMPVLVQVEGALGLALIAGLGFRFAALNERDNPQYQIVQ